MPPPPLVRVVHLRLSHLSSPPTPSTPPSTAPAARQARTRRRPLDRLRRPAPSSPPLPLPHALHPHPRSPHPRHTLHPSTPRTRRTCARERYARRRRRRPIRVAALERCRSRTVHPLVHASPPAPPSRELHQAACVFTDPSTPDRIQCVCVCVSTTSPQLRLPPNGSWNENIRFILIFSQTFALKREASPIRGGDRSACTRRLTWNNCVSLLAMCEWWVH
jgi:hypothetical protein